MGASTAAALPTGWSASTTVSARGVVAVQPASAANARGDAVLAWRARTAAGEVVQVAVHRAGATAWAAPLTLGAPGGLGAGRRGGDHRRRPDPRGLARTRGRREPGVRGNPADRRDPPARDPPGPGPRCLRPRRGRLRRRRARRGRLDRTRAAVGQQPRPPAGTGHGGDHRPHRRAVAGAPPRSVRATAGGSRRQRRRPGPRRPPRPAASWPGGTRTTTSATSSSTPRPSRRPACSGPDEDTGQFGRGPTRTQLAPGADGTAVGLWADNEDFDEGPLVGALSRAASGTWSPVVLPQTFVAGAPRLARRGDGLLGAWADSRGGVSAITGPGVTGPFGADHRAGRRRAGDPARRRRPDRGGHRPRRLVVRDRRDRDGAHHPERPASVRGEHLPRAVGGLPAGREPGRRPHARARRRRARRRGLQPRPAGESRRPGLADQPAVGASTGGDASDRSSRSR